MRCRPLLIPAGGAGGGKGYFFRNNQMITAIAPMGMAIIEKMNKSSRFPGMVSFGLGIASGRTPPLYRPRSPAANFRRIVVGWRQASSWIGAGPCESCLISL